MVHVHCKKRSVTEHPRGAIFYCFRGNSMGYHGNSKILLPWGVPIHRVFYSVEDNQVSYSLPADLLQTLAYTMTHSINTSCLI